MIHFDRKVLGIVVLTLAIYIRAEWTIKHYILELQAYQMWTGPYILMASSVLTILLSFFGCWGAVNENPFNLFVVRMTLFLFQKGLSLYVA